MTEYRNLTFGESFTYKGLIDVKGLYRLIDKWFKGNGYEKAEVWNFEEVYESGKQITLKLHPFKKISDYAKIEIRLTATLINLKETIIEQDGIKNNYMTGQGKFSFDTFIVTDYEGQWSEKPFYFFVKTLLDKLVYKSQTDKYEEILLTDKDKIKREIKSFLNMTRFGEV